MFELVFTMGLFLLPTTEQATIDNKVEAKTTEVAVPEAEYVEKNIDDLFVASIRYKGSYEEMGTYFGKLMEAAGQYINGPSFALYHDQTESDTHDIEICLPIPDTVKLEGVNTRLVKGGRFITFEYTGHYETLASAWEKFFAYITEKKIKTDMPPIRELYIVFNPVAPKENITELQIPIKANKAANKKDM